MTDTFYFYDLETSGIDPAKSRIMQFAGQRTDKQLNPIGKPLTTLIKLTSDILPDPYAIMVTSITPQQTLKDGLSEADFLKLFYKEIQKGNTIFTGFNNVRFDDEFIRYLNFRNFYEPYEWQWKNGNSRWDLLDMVRMTRALRPDGIDWPMSSEGKPSNRLELLSSINKLAHKSAHDAMSDVAATINLAKLIQSKQPKLFSFLLSIRNKKAVNKLVNSKKPYIYTSGHFSSSILHTTIVYTLCLSNDATSALVYDLRQDPKLFLDLSVDELVDIWRYSDNPEDLRLPIKTLKFNRVPAVAPLSVLDDNSKNRLSLNMDIINNHYKDIKKRSDEFAKKMLAVVDKLDSKRQAKQADLIVNEYNVDEQLYDNFIDKSEHKLMNLIRSSTPDKLNKLNIKFKDKRLEGILPLYFARNYPNILNEAEKAKWQAFCYHKLTKSTTSLNISSYFNKLDQIAKTKSKKEDKYVLQELNLFGQSVLQALETYESAH